MSVFIALKTMHDKFGIERLEKPDFLDEEHMDFRLKFLREELQETEDAYYSKDLEETIDGLIDLIVVAVGTLDLMGVDGQLHFNEVHYCNMTKEVVKNADESKRGFHIDLKKPEGWIPPNHKKVLKSYE